MTLAHDDYLEQMGLSPDDTQHRWFDVDIDVVDGVPVYQPVPLFRVDDEEFAEAFLLGTIREITSHGEPIKVVEFGDGWLYFLGRQELGKFHKDEVPTIGAAFHQTKEERDLRSDFGKGKFWL